MSLFNETVKRLSIAEAELAEMPDLRAKLKAANRKIADLEAQLAACRRQAPIRQRHLYDLNSLSDEDTERLFASFARKH